MLQFKNWQVAHPQKWVAFTTSGRLLSTAIGNEKYMFLLKADPG